MKFNIYFRNRYQKMSNQLITLLNKEECFSFIIFGENYLNGISCSKNVRNNIEKSVRIFTIWPNKGTV